MRLLHVIRGVAFLTMLSLQHGSVDPSVRLTQAKPSTLITSEKVKTTSNPTTAALWLLESSSSIDYDLRLLRNVTPVSNDDELDRMILFNDSLPLDNQKRTIGSNCSEAAGTARYPVELKAFWNTTPLDKTTEHHDSIMFLDHALLPPLESDDDDKPFKRLFEFVFSEARWQSVESLLDWLVSLDILETASDGNYQVHEKWSFLRQVASLCSSAMTLYGLLVRFVAKFIKLEDNVKDVEEEAVAEKEAGPKAEPIKTPVRLTKQQRKNAAKRQKEKNKKMRCQHQSPLDPVVTIVELYIETTAAAATSAATNCDEESFLTAATVNNSMDSDATQSNESATEQEMSDLEESVSTLTHIIADDNNEPMATVVEESINSSTSQDDGIGMEFIDVEEVAATASLTLAAPTERSETFNEVAINEMGMDSGPSLHKQADITANIQSFKAGSLDDDAKYEPWEAPTEEAAFITVVDKKGAAREQKRQHQRKEAIRSWPHALAITIAIAITVRRRPTLYKRSRLE
jgi:hypothetical protein